MVKQSIYRLRRVLAALLSVIMVLGVFQQMVFAEEIVNGNWTITNETNSGKATYKGLDLTYYSPTTVIIKNGDGIRSDNSNGKANKGIIDKSAGSYAEFKPASDGTFTINIANTSNDKSAYLNAVKPDGTVEVLAEFNTNSAVDPVYIPGVFKQTAGKSGWQLDIETEKENTYLFTVTGSKMACYEASFVPYREVSGTITDSTGTFPTDPYKIKFIEKTTDIEKIIDVNGSSYSVSLKPGEYSVNLVGSIATSYSFTNESRSLSVSAGNGTLSKDLTIEASVSYTISGDILGLPDDYDTSDLSLIFVPEDSASFDRVKATINGSDEPSETTSEAQTSTSPENPSETETSTTSENPSETTSETTPGDNDGSVKAELSGDKAISFVSGVDNLKYKQAGFMFESDGKSADKNTNVVYTSIAGSKVTSDDLKKPYLYAFTITDIEDPDAEIKVTPYVVTLSGEKVASKTSTFSLNSLAASKTAFSVSEITYDANASSVTEPNENADVNGLTYSALLAAGEKYTLVVEGAKDYKLKEAITAKYDTADPVDQPVEFIPVEKYNVSGGFLGLTEERGKYDTLSDVTPTAIKFTNVDDKYEYEGTPSKGGYTASLRDGSYLASITADGYSTSTHVVVKGGAVTRDLLLKDTTPKTVEYKDTLTVGEDKDYKTVQAAVDAVSAMTRPKNERVVIKLDPGTYREQVNINAPNITLEGASRDDTKITWYYGIGYKYYSCVNNLYDPYADYDKFEKGNVEKHWGATVITQKTATGFKAENVTFENSFNKYMTEEEISDGVEPNGLQSINVARKENTNVDTKEATERAAALVNYADQIEFNNCSFLGSQDTLYTTNTDNHKSYYKNCYIEGQTDYIYGSGDVIFDGCELNFCGYDGTKSGGYITANSNSKKEDTYGYIFRGCYVSYNSERDTTPGGFGRMWGSCAKVAFLNTQLQDKDMIIPEGWSEMGDNKPTDPGVTLVEYNTTYNGEKVDTSKRVVAAKDSVNMDDYSVETVFIKNGWTPTYYTPETVSEIAFTEDPTFSTNGDPLLPNPGMKITVSYKLNVENDASLISWYAVDPDADRTSLDTMLQKSTLLSSGSAAASKTFQVPMECAGKYIMAVVTPISVSGLKGSPKYQINTNAPVSSEWSDPDDPGSIAPGSGINIYLAGDSTVKDYTNPSKRNEGSWGEFLQYFFESPDYVKVNNYAEGGRSLRLFLNEGKFDAIMQNIKEGDYLFIQFGHNDCANSKDSDYVENRFVPLFYPADQKCDSNFPTVQPDPSMKKDGRYTWDCGATYKGYLQYYIDHALEKGAIPVVVSPVSRLSYASDGTIKPHHDAGDSYDLTKDFATTNNAYVRACEEVYEANKDKGVLYLDGFGLTKKLYEDAYKDCKSDKNGYDIMTVSSEGKKDGTHNNKTGGVIIAGLIAKWIQDANIAPSKYVVQPETVYGENSDGEYIFTIEDSKFTAKNMNYEESSYWSQVGQELFDSLSGSVKEVNLNFGSDEALALYDTNAATTFDENGVYEGTYKNADGQRYRVSVYKDAISYYESTASYGTKAIKGKALFSFDAAEPGVYTVKATASTCDSASTVNLYSDSALGTSVADDAINKDEPGEIVYTKTTEGPETLYFSASVSNNLYISDVSISKEELPEVKPNKIYLDFTQQEAYDLYEGDATDYVDGVYTGTYTNDEGQKFEVSIYDSGIQYLNASSLQYGTKVSAGKPILSFVADEAAMYTIEYTKVNEGTLGLYKEQAANGTPAASGAPIIYKKADAAPETLYLAVCEGSNLYIPKVSIKKSELPKEELVLTKGSVNGIESTDSDIMLTLKGQTETKTISADEYKSTGVELIKGETYTVSAKGAKGVYKSATEIVGGSASADITLTRIEFDFPLEISAKSEDFAAYTEAKDPMKGFTDPYSGITVFPSGMLSISKQYGAKTNSNDILSFIAPSTGTITVTVTVSASNSDKLVLKKDGQDISDVVDAVQGQDSVLTAEVSEGDVIVLNTPTKSNLYYKYINVETAAPASIALDENVPVQAVTADEAVSDEVSDDVISDETSEETPDDSEIPTEEEGSDETVEAAEETSPTDIILDIINMTDGGTE